MFIPDRSRVKNAELIPSEVRLYSGSIDLFRRRRRRRRRRHGPRPSQPLLQTYSLPNSQQTLTFVTELCTRDLEALTIAVGLLQPVVFQAHYYTWPFFIWGCRRALLRLTFFCSVGVPHICATPSNSREARTSLHIVYH